MNKNTKTILALVLALVLSISCFVGCSAAAQTVSTGSAKLATGGTLCLKVNPEIAIRYDENGNVTELIARNEDAKKILESVSGYVGKPTREVVSQLVTAIGNAGYFVEEIEGDSRKITIEIESGSSLPTGTFLDDVIAAVKKIVENHNWSTPIDVEGESLFGLTDYKDTDYGAGNDGRTDYGKTDYDDTDYGPNNDGITDYDDTDYGPNNDGVTDYDDTDYGPNNDGVTDYNKTDNGSSGKKKTGNGTDYGKTDYGKTDYGKTDYGKTDYGKTDYGKTDYDNGKTDYGKSDYGKTDYN